MDNNNIQELIRWSQSIDQCDLRIKVAMKRKQIVTSRVSRGEDVLHRGELSLSSA